MAPPVDADSADFVVNIAGVSVSNGGVVIGDDVASSDPPASSQKGGGLLFSFWVICRSVIGGSVW